MASVGDAMYLEVSKAVSTGPGVMEGWAVAAGVM